MEMDRWSFRPGLVSLGTVTLLELICQLPGLLSFVLIPVSLVGYAIGSITILVAGSISLLKRRPRKAASLSGALIFPVLLWFPINWAADCVHLGLTAGFGVGQLGVPSKSDGSEFMAYDWSVGLVGGPNTFLIHDVTDDIALPMAQHTHTSISIGRRFWGRMCRQGAPVVRPLLHLHILSDPGPHRYFANRR
jgi:hypothetical protein